MIRSRTASALACVALGCAPLASCATTPDEPAEDFSQLSRDQLQTQKGRLALHIREIDEIMRDGVPNTDRQRLQIAQHLEGINGILEELDPEVWHEDHAELVGHFDNMRRDVRMARIAVLEEPPEFFFLGAVTGTCTSCHEQRDSPQ